MDYHQTLRVAGGLMALLLFIPMLVGIVRNAKGQSFATWLLWGALDIILTISIVEQHGNFLLPAGFALGDVIVVAWLISKGIFEWGWFENGILAMVIGCTLAWKLCGPRTATVTATMGICVAGIPGLLAMWKQPQRKMSNVWAGYIFANGLSFFGGTAMTIEERFAPSAFALFSFAMFLASRRMSLFTTPPRAP